ncbi:hypothetical protein JXM67_06615 [candidate division WOR-3 bacterium]|nr:hypothetical protein [candidate division WOR-3 bacterium]
MKRVFILIGLVFLGKIYAEEQAPAAVHLKLGKDTLALAEPAILTIEITNNQESLVFVHISHLAYSRGFRITLLTPDGNEWEYKPDFVVHIDYISEGKVLFQLHHGESVTDDLLIWWTLYFPKEYRNSIEMIPSGTYKMFVKFPLDYQKLESVEGAVIYSDTLEFQFLPLEDSYLDILCELDSLCDFFAGPAPKWSEGRPRFERIRDSQTPYCEGAWAYLISWLDDYDELACEKKAFDSKYPNSQFSPFLAECEFMECFHFTMGSKPIIVEPNYRPVIEPKADSLLEVWSRMTPGSIRMLWFKEYDKFLSRTEFTERYFPQEQIDKSKKKGCLLK